MNIVERGQGAVSTAAAARGTGVAPFAGPERRSSGVPGHTGIGRASQAHDGTCDRSARGSIVCLRAGGGGLRQRNERRILIRQRLHSDRRGWGGGVVGPLPPVRLGEGDWMSGWGAAPDEGAAVWGAGRWAGVGASAVRSVCAGKELRGQADNADTGIGAASQSGEWAKYCSGRPSRQGTPCRHGACSRNPAERGGCHRAGRVRTARHNGGEGPHQRGAGLRTRRGAGGRQCHVPHPCLCRYAKIGYMVTQ